jgi:erythromycin esterase-like protein
MLAHVEESTLTGWMKRNARPFDTCTPSERVSDLRDLRRIVGKARIVALGEGTHGTREFFQLKHRITQYLATEMGFTVFAIEANLPEAWRINDYVLGGPGDPRALIKGMYFWTWDTEEVLEMVEWMRRFNASKRGRIEFTGFDMQVPDTAAAIVRRYLATHDPVWADSIKVAEKPSTLDPGFMSVEGTLPAATFAGHTARYSGFIRTERVSRFAGLWMRADAGKERAIAFDNMRSQAVSGTSGWKRYEIELTIPARTDSISFGVLMSGEGTAWFDSLVVEIDGAPWTASSIDLALEVADGPRGLRLREPHPRFSFAMDDTFAASGSRSLRLSGAPTEESKFFEPTVATTQRLVHHLEASRGQLGAATTPAQADWVIRNAHVLLQHAQSKIGSGWSSQANVQRASLVRDSSMAANITWIVDEARKGSKAVLWAHNFHVAKQQGSMGKWLADRYGNDLVVVGFAANEGTYTATGTGSGKVGSDHVLKPGPLGSIEYVAHETGLPRFLLDLRPAHGNPEAQKLLHSGLTMRAIGSMAMDDQFSPAAILDNYDVLAWVDSTEASRPLRRLDSAPKK